MIRVFSAGTKHLFIKDLKQTFLDLPRVMWCWVYRNHVFYGMFAAMHTEHSVKTDSGWLSATQSLLVFQADKQQKTLVEKRDCNSQKLSTKPVLPTCGTLPFRVAKMQVKRTLFCKSRHYHHISF